MIKILDSSYLAVQRKLLTILYSLWKGEQAFDPNHQNRTKNEEQTEVESPESNEQTPQTKTAPTVTEEAAEGRPEPQATPKTPVNSKPKKSGA